VDLAREPAALVHHGRELQRAAGESGYVSGLSGPPRTDSGR
jgi:hypothetical protein